MGLEVSAFHQSLLRAVGLLPSSHGQGEHFCDGLMHRWERTAEEDQVSVH